MEELQARHRKELRDLQGRITQKKKQASKKTRKGVNDECDRLEAELKNRQAAELAETSGITNIDETLAGQVQDLDLDKASYINDEVPQDDNDEQPQSHEGEALVPSQVRKPNRQKARLAKRAAEQEEIARQAAAEADSLPDMKQQERGRMLDSMKEHSLQEKEIRADGHCLYSAVADQLTQLGVRLSTAPTDQPVIPYKQTRNAAADYIESHGDDFAGFLEEPLTSYVHKIRDTAEWGGQLELQALAKVYDVQINVLQDFGRVEKIQPGSDAEAKEIWLGYYKHGFGLGEHYNSLRRKS
ncbi:hypothetical protein AMS68_005435 [Peltaster fructicola]|uniref:OTU domain-containing protein n=1 Tax=Peltaster fructicola TaxID=286661 RepID=A0A6H0XZ98_9PEZI|nr:hypothetical protein AMS68_005435 [Peltaster fructicola]